VNHEIAVESKKKGLRRKNLLSNGSLLWWGTALLDLLLPLVRHDFGGFSSGEAGREDVR
jgi:hypothetical protein